ncbi:MAG: polyprenyl synthetase family protein, partial [Saprospiraceae bacterium]|nr:polyprenyl synthetase family protein [Saprospiraceae bacterium]
PRAEKRRVINTVKRHSNNPDRVAEVIEFVRNSGGIEYAREAMLKYREEAFVLLRQFPASEVREALFDLVTFVTERKK